MRIGMGYGIRPQHELILALEKGKPQHKDLGFPNVLSYPRANCADHIHEKPVELLERLIEQNTLPGNTVLDPFMGSGSTGVACQRLARHFIGIELNPAFVKVASERMAIPATALSLVA
jgi:site-specific DNA-methyltransferase (adenine-specific)